MIGDSVALDPIVNELFFLNFVVVYPLLKGIQLPSSWYSALVKIKSKGEVMLNSL